MNSALETYFRYSERVARLMAWLQVALERHDEQASDFDEPVQLWPMVNRLAYIQEELIFLLICLTGMKEKEINNALNDGGPDNE